MERPPRALTALQATCPMLCQGRIFDLNESGDLGAIAVLGLLMLVLTFTVVVLINRIPDFGGIRLRNN
jgi:hypothetical protein